MTKVSNFTEGKIFSPLVKFDLKYIDNLQISLSSNNRNSILDIYYMKHVLKHNFETCF